MHLIDEIYENRMDSFRYKLDVDFIQVNSGKYDHESFYELIDILVTILDNNRDDLIDPYPMAADCHLSRFSTISSSRSNFLFSLIIIQY